MLQSLATWPRVLAIVLGLLLVLGMTLAAAIAFGTAAPPRPVQPRQLDLMDLPALSRYTARDGNNSPRARPASFQQTSDDGSGAHNPGSMSGGGAVGFGWRPTGYSI
jgi:hypothetical protein